jgi:hypothetical protein
MAAMICGKSRWTQVRRPEAERLQCLLNCKPMRMSEVINNKLLTTNYYQECQELAGRI